MAYRALRVVAPFPVTIHALPVISTSESGLAQILRVDSFAMAFFASGYLTGRRVMVTFRTALTHSSHLGVQSVSKHYRNILVLQFIDDNDLGTLLRDMIAGNFRPLSRTAV
jgi:hypothetical protein